MHHSDHIFGNRMTRSLGRSAGHPLLAAEEEAWVGTPRIVPVQTLAEAVGMFPTR